MARRKPDLDDDDDDVRSATRSDVDRVKERAAAATARMDPDEPEEVEIDDDPDADLDARTPTRQERRANRFREAEEKRIAAEAKAEALTAENNRLQQLALRPTGTQAAPVSPTADLEAARDKVQREQQALFKEFAQVEAQYKGQIPTDVHQKYLKQAEELESRKFDVEFEIRERKRAPQRAQETLSQQMLREFPDVYANRNAQLYLMGQMNIRIARGEKDSKELHDECAREARQVILGVRPPPTSGQRARATGMSRGGGAPTGNGGTTPKTMTITPDMKKMAKALYPGLPEKQAIQRWANRAGKRHMENVQKQR